LAQQSAESEEPQEGKDYHIKGFILNKLLLGNYRCKVGKKHHGKHISVEDIPKGYPKEHRGKFPKLIKDLKKKGYIMIFTTKYGKQACLSLNSQNIDEILQLINRYRKAVNLPPLNKKFKEII